MMDSYYFAKGSGRGASSFQIQRLHATCHAEPLYDLRQKNVSRKKVKRAINALNPVTSVMYPLTLDPDLLLYDGSLPPLPSDQDEPIYMASSYDEPKLRSIQLSSHGVLFNPVSTPYLQRPEPRRARIDSLTSASPAANISALSPLSSTGRRDSQLMDRGQMDDIIDDFLGQPVCWLLVFSKGNYKLVDQVTGTVIGKWVKSPTDSAGWNFVVKGNTVAIMNGNYIELSHSADGESFVDEFSYNMRQRYLAKSRSAMANGTFATSLRRQILPRTGLSTGDLDVSRKDAKKINIYRARVLDGVLFSGIALKFAEKGRSRSASPDDINSSSMYSRQNTSDSLVLEKKKRRMSGIFNSIKQVWS